MQEQYELGLGNRWNGGWRAFTEMGVEMRQNFQNLLQISLSLRFLLSNQLKILSNRL